MAILIAVISVAAAGLAGGWEWMLPCLVVVLQVRRTGSQVTEVLATIVPGLIWLALYNWTEDRRLYFPYTMQYAIQLACLLRGRVTWPAIKGGGSIIGLFTLIRIGQEATPRVLGVELAVAAAILAVVLAAYRWGAKDAARRCASATAASLLAFAGLAF